MPRKKQAESAKSRRQKLLDYFHSHPRQARFISDVKDDLSIKNEQNLRRDLELLAEEGMLEKTKDTSKLPARAVFILKEGAPQSLKAQSKGSDDSQAESQENESGAEISQDEPQASAQDSKSAAGDLKGRRSARELEQRILSLLESQPTTVKDLAEHLKRQQPTVTKALERMQERRLVERKRQGRSFVYSRLSRASAPSMPAAVSASSEPMQIASATPAVDTGSIGAQNLSDTSLQGFIDAAVQAGINAGVNAALKHILAHTSR